MDNNNYNSNPEQWQSKEWQSQQMPPSPPSIPTPPPTAQPIPPQPAPGYSYSYSESGSYPAQHGQQYGRPATPPPPPQTVNVNYYNYAVPVSTRSRIAAFLLCFFFGVIGIHRFYVGKVGTGILYLLTGGLFGIGVLVDLILIIVGSFRDNYGYYLK